MSSPENCFCGRPRSGDSAWFCSDDCARQDSLNTLLGIPSSPNVNSLPRVAPPPPEPVVAPSPTRSERASSSAAWKSHYRAVEAQRAAVRRSDVMERVRSGSSRPEPGQSISVTSQVPDPGLLVLQTKTRAKQAPAPAHDRKSSLSSSASRASTLFSNPATSHSSGSSVAPRSPHMIPSRDKAGIVENEDDAWATCLDEWGGMEDASSFDGDNSPRKPQHQKQQLSARQMSAMQQRTVAELFEEIARARELSPWASKESSSASDLLDVDVSVESETDLDPLNDDALAPFMAVQPPKSVPRPATAPALPGRSPPSAAPVQVSLPIKPLTAVSSHVAPKQAAIVRELHLRPAQSSNAIPSSTYAPPHPPNTVPRAARNSRSALDLRGAMSSLPLRRQAVKASVPPSTRPDALSFLPANDKAAASAFQPDKARSSLLRLPLSLGRGLSRAGDKLRSRMSTLPLTRPDLSASEPPRVPAHAAPILEPSPSAAILEMDIAAQSPTPSARSRHASSPRPRTAPSSSPGASSSSTFGSRPIRDSRVRTKSFHEADGSVLGDANASYLLLRVPKMPPRAGAFPSTPSPFRSPATDFPPSPTSSQPSSRRESTASRLSVSVADLTLARPCLDSSPTIEFYRDRPLPPTPSPTKERGGMLHPGQVLAMRAQSQTTLRPLRRAESQSTVMPRIVVHPYAAGVSEESSADESDGDADAAIDVLRRLRTNAPRHHGQGHGLGLGLSHGHHQQRPPRGVVDSL
ncbi:hypothetical protein EXIGLDRAFT_776460 [Exidia glandulosa HHB12029]|uniref:Uncharacterized protein n=1 Tax=Exidia glandulosa HHB12029 TaxID=1314781 RepID=A0A165DH90_EXIGL|nr:hypothetical protein EXIGLDRAFT_776460 [Exidia glandulosa HHB12029]